jgi:hypothetical protein
VLCSLEIAPFARFRLALRFDPRTKRSRTARRHWRSHEKHVAWRDIGSVVDTEIASAGLSSPAWVEDVFPDALVRRVPRGALRER